MIFKYENIFNDHLEIAKKKFYEEFDREPSIDELLWRYQKLMEYFYE